MNFDALLNPGVVAALLSAIAAVAAAIATWRAPISAAKMAENLRRQGDRELESRRFRLNVFASIMQGRAEIYSEDTVRALNSIDVAFNRSASVREAWAELYQALNTMPTPSHVVDERIRKLLREMATDLGLADTLRLDDFARIYFPKAMSQEREMRVLQRQEALERLAGRGSSPPSPESVSTLWPPKPGETRT